MPLVPPDVATDGNIGGYEVDVIIRLLPKKAASEGGNCAQRQTLTLGEIADCAAKVQHWQGLGVKPDVVHAVFSRQGTRAKVLYGLVETELVKMQS